MADISLIQDESFNDPEDGGNSIIDGCRDFYQRKEESEETLSQCAKFKKYALSEHTCNRQMVPSILLEIFRDASSVDSLPADLPELMDIIAGLADDNETVVRTELVQRIPHLAAACVEYSSRVPALGSVVEEHLLPLVVKYIDDADTHVRKSSHATLLTLMEQSLVPRHAIEMHVCPKILDYTYTEKLMDNQMEAVTLMGKMVPLLGREKTERLFLQRFSELCSSTMFYIRKICAYSLGEFCAVVGRNAYEHVLLPCFIELCSDDIWGVRKACAEVIMTVSCVCTPESRRDALAPAFVRLLQDQSRWVRMSAYQTLGPFISTFADPSIIGLAYNQLGELVLINPAGTEFRINSPAFIDANQKAAADFKLRLYQAQEQIDNTENDNELNIQMAAIFGNDELTENSNDVQESSSSAIFLNGDIVIVDNSVGDAMHNTTENKVNEETNCKGDSESKSEENKSSDLFEVDDVLADLIADILLEVSPKKSSKTEDKEADDLDKYNLYQYWYISPELPLDPSIVESCGTSNKADDNTFIDRLDDIQFNNSLSRSMDETLPLNKTKASTGTTIVSTTLSTTQQNTATQQIVPQLLIDHFVSMIDADLAENTDCDMAYHCAFSLPAVALTLGRSNWFLLKNTCKILASDMQYKIRRTVASSLHELAQILGQELTVEDLLPIFDGFIKDLDEVRIGVLKHLAHFLKLIGPEKRNLYLPRLAKFLVTDSKSNWRFREELGNQLLMAVPLFSPLDASKHIAMLAQELLCDQVFAVRQVAICLVTELVRHVCADPNLTSCLLLKLAEEFAHSKRWVRRQAFALLCSRLISKNALPPDQFATIIMPHLLDLSWDPVPNVRIAVSRTLSRDIMHHEYFSNENSEQHEPVSMVLRRLQADKDRDVCQYALPLVH